MNNLSGPPYNCRCTRVALGVAPSELIAITTSMTEEEALDVYALTGDWDEVKKWAVLNMKGISGKKIIEAIACGWSREELEEIMF